jgi:hypothetical protein
LLRIAGKGNRKDEHYGQNSNHASARWFKR